VAIQTPPPLTALQFETSKQDGAEQFPWLEPIKHIANKIFNRYKYTHTYIHTVHTLTHTHTYQGVTNANICVNTSSSVTAVCKSATIIRNRYWLEQQKKRNKGKQKRIQNEKIILFKK
jgi:hypothetical protein